MTKRLYSLLLFFLCGFSLSSFAQLGQNILPNGGFEDYGTTPPKVASTRAEESADDDSNDSDDSDDDSAEDNRLEFLGTSLKLQFWFINGTLYPQRTKDAHGGKYAIRFYPNGGSFFSRDADFNPSHLRVKGGATYRLTYWYKGQKMKNNVVTTIDWFRGGTKLKKDERKAAADLATNISETWQKKEIIFEAPRQADHAGVGFNLELDDEAQTTGGYIQMDDISLVMIAEPAEIIKLLPPTDLKAKAQQREILLSWSPVEQAKAQYEVRVNGEVKTTTSETKCLLTHLEPNTNYTITIATRLGEERSEKTAQLAVKTEQLDRGVNDNTRIPHLYMIRENGTCPRRLPLYWRDLAENAAKITYEIDDQAVQPDGDFLVFSSAGNHVLRIVVVESPEREWTLEYVLQVD